jgi:hypothetical protein
MRVVLMDPGPMPTFTASTPAAISSRVPSAVATLPGINPGVSIRQRAHHGV